MTLQTQRTKYPPQLTFSLLRIPISFQGLIFPAMLFLIHIESFLLIQHYQNLSVNFLCIFILIYKGQRQTGLGLVHYRGNLREVSNKENQMSSNESKEKITERSTTSTVKYNYDRELLKTKQQLNKESSHMSSRLYNLVNFSFKPDSKRAHLSNSN